MWKQLLQVYKYIVSYSDSRPQTMLRVFLPVHWFIFCMLLETCCISFSLIDMLDGRRRGEVWGRGAMDFLQILFVWQMVWFIRAILYKDTVIKNHKFLFSGTRVTLENLCTRQGSRRVVVTVDEWKKWRGYVHLAVEKGNKFLNISLLKVIFADYCQ